MKEIVYRVPGKHFGPNGKSYDFIPVESEDELNQRLKDGWFNTLEEAVNGTHGKRARNDDGEFVGDNPATPDVNEAYEPTRAEMETKAKQLGISFSMMTTDKKLLKAIDKKIKKG